MNNQYGPLQIDVLSQDIPKSRFAFISFVDEKYMRGFVVLLKSLVLSQDSLRNVDIIVLHCGLPRASMLQICTLFPRVIFHEVNRDEYAEIIRPPVTNHLGDEVYFSLEAFRFSGYESLILLDCDLLILGDLTHLFGSTDKIAGVPQFYENPEGKLLNTGVLVLGQDILSEKTWSSLVGIGGKGQFELGKHDQGIVNSFLRGEFEPLDWGYNTVKRRLKNIRTLPPNVRVLHFVGSRKPWLGSLEKEYRFLEQMWHKFDVQPKDFFFQALRRAVRSKDLDLATFFGQSLIASGGANALEVNPLLELLLRTGDFAGLRRISAQVADKDGWKKYYDALLLAAEGKVREALFQLASLLISSRVTKSRILKNLFRLAWVSGDYNLAEAYLKELQYRDSFDPALESQALQLKQLKEFDAENTAIAEKGNSYLAHVAFFVTEKGNAGDKVLVEATRKTLGQAFPAHDFVPVHAHQAVKPSNFETLASSDAIVIGGGGLFLKDTAPNLLSGWQWNVSTEQIQRLGKKFVVFGVGYNRFPGQAEFEQVFKASLYELVANSIFFGLRNQGSVREIRKYLPENQADLVDWQPCPSTIISRLFPERFHTEVDRHVVAINVALDRLENRFHMPYEEFLSEMNKFVIATNPEHEVVVACHSKTDEKFVLDLKRQENIDLRSVPLYDLQFEEIISFYRSCKVVIGMRGHAGMIPFGCGTPIISLVTHPKLKFFLEDVGFPEWAVDVERGFSAQLLSTFDEITSNLPAAISGVNAASQILLEKTTQNLSLIASRL